MLTHDIEQFYSREVLMECSKQKVVFLRELKCSHERNEDSGVHSKSKEIVTKGFTVWGSKLHYFLGLVVNQESITKISPRMILIQAMSG